MNPQRTKRLLITALHLIIWCMGMVFIGVIISWWFAAAIFLLLASLTVLVNEPIYILELTEEEEGDEDNE